MLPARTIVAGARGALLLHQSDSRSTLSSLTSAYESVGDALGTTLEFEEPGAFEPIEEFEGGGPFSLTAGQWTDDTSMALCLAESLITTATFDPADQMSRYRQHGTACVA
jgi:ADP-ribosylglycohydrolase